jgi:predicted metalloprotease with PDZ domain
LAIQDKLRVKVNVAGEEVVMGTSSAEYRVRVLPERHELEVELLLRGEAAEGEVRLQTPTWVPGAYGFVTIARDLFDVRAEDAETAAPLEVSRDGWQGFRIAGARGAVRVSFKAHAYDVSRGEIAGILDDRYAVLLGTRYLHAPAYQGPVRVGYAFPAGWKAHHPAGARRVETAVWEYPSFEILVDTPVVAGVAGEIAVTARRLHDRDFAFVFVDRGVGFETEAPAFVDDVMKVAGACHDVFGSFPFDGYSFVLTLNPAADWGLEHRTSTMCGLGPDVFVDPDERARGVRVCAHELFHAWNVRRLRPAPLEAPDLERGSFTEGLWVAEGFTRYYEFLLCARAGVYTAEQFFANVVNYHEHLAMTPAYARVSAVDSSLSTYLNHTRYAGSINDTIDYYDKGMLIAFDLDAALRLGGSSLDLAMRAFYDRHAGRPPGFTTDDVLELFGGIDPALVELLRREALGPAGLSVLAQLARLGFRVDTAPARYLGLVLSAGAGPVVENVADTSPAGFSGLASGDRILRANGYPFSAKALAWLIAHEPKVDLEVLRGHRVLSFPVPTAERMRVTALSWAGTEEQAARIRAWVGREDFRPAPGQAIPLDFYENFHGVQALV